MLRHCILVFLLAGTLWLPASVVGQGQPGGGGVTIHVVQRGETLYQIGLQYGLTTDQLAALNGISDQSNIWVGQTLLVPVISGPVTPPAQTHIVQPGESLQSIAGLYGIDARALATENHVTAENPLVVGQQLRIAFPPPERIAAPPTDAPPEPEGVLHTVIDGDTLFKIATQYGVTVADLVQTNGIDDPTLIFAGQQLLIPGVQPPQIAAVLPAPATRLTVDPLVLVEGQSGRFRLWTSSEVTVSGTFLDRPLADGVDAGGVHSMLVGVPVFTAPGIYPLALTMTDTTGVSQTIEANIQVVGGSYGSEYINLLEDRTGLLDPNIENAELSLIQSVAGAFTATRYFDGPMGLPAAAAMTSPFGTRRSYNGGGFDRFHSGADFAGAPGSPVIAPAPGMVVLADTLNVRGNAIMIDHGWGVFSGYWHQTEMYVRPGEMVKTGQVIGTIGSTGRVTGAHLHWEVWVNGVPVDPMQWVRQSFS